MVISIKIQMQAFFFILGQRALKSYLKKKKFSKLNENVGGQKSKKTAGKTQ
jgi:hypothetical protein